MARKIQVKRGNQVNLPNLDVGEFGFTIDQKRTYIGSPTGNVELAKQSDVASVTSQLAEIANTDASTYTGILGAELVDATGWTVPTGWTGSFASGYVNTPGNTNVLSRAMPPTGTKLYQVAFRVESPTPAGVPNASTDFAVKIGNSASFVTYQGGGNFDYTFGIRSVSDGPLEFVPGPTFDGTIKNVSVKEIAGELTPLSKVEDEFGNVFKEERTSAPWLENVFIGKQSGRVNTTGRENVAVGSHALKSNTTGYWNSALGRRALEENTTGSRNIALGYLALKKNISGDRNIAVGTFTLERNTHGRQNIALGADTMWYNTTGSRNIAIGMAVMADNDSGNENIALGFIALEKNLSGGNNIAIGLEALNANKTASNNIGIGREALKRADISSIHGNIGIGFASGVRVTTGFANTIIGNSALSQNQEGIENTVVGHNAAALGAVGSITSNALFGAFAGSKLTTGGNNNTLIGFGAGRELTTGNNNILIGRNVEGSSATVSGEINIGNVFKSNIFTKRATIGDGITHPTARLHLPGQSAEAQSAPLKFEQGVLMTTPEPGAFEYSAGKLYFTVANGTRREVAFV